MSDAQSSTKSFLVTGILSAIFGIFGADRFYLGKTGSGIAKLLTLGGCGVWYLVDLVILIVGNQTDSRGQRLEGATTKNKLIVVAIVIIFAIIGAATPKPTGALIDSNSQKETEETVSWTDVVSMSGTSDGAVSETFTVGSGEKRITYSISGGSFLLYAAAPGVDIDVEGALPILSGYSDGTHTETVELEAGTYTLDLRPVLTDSWSLTLQEKG